MTQINKISRAMEIPPPPVTGESEDEWLDVRSLFRIVRRRLGIIILVTLAVLGAALPIILNIERDYSAAARILIHEPRPAALASSGLVSDNDLNLSTEQERLLSRKNAISVISELDLKNNPEFNPSLRREPFLARVKNGLRVALVGHPEDVTDGATSLDLVIQTYLGHLSITRSTGSEVVAIRFSSQDPQLAASVPNTLIRVYMEEREQRAAERLGRAEGWLKERIAEQRQRLSKVAAEADAFQEESQLALIDAQGAPETITGLKRRLANLVRERDELSAKLAQLENAQPDDLIEIVKSEVLLDLEREIDNEQVKVELLLDRYGSGHPEVLTANARIAGLEHSLENEIDRERERLAGEIEMLKREDAALHVALASAQRTLADGRRLDVTLGRLQLAADTERSALNRLEEQLRALQAEAELPVNEIEVLSPASVPLFADGRGRSYYLAAALFAASALAMTVAFFLEMIDKSVRSQEHLRKIQGLSPVGFLPSIGRQARRQILGGPKKVGRLYWDSVEAVVLALEQLNNGALPQSLLVTSALPGEVVPKNRTLG
ncbi:GumC family protein [Tranquillimonas alkanivorans]|uniref:Receptor protein-tyrosine kinase n=1 Tax=Tranquillimonas alkanivorans TaxID=441119 RepID=A0A1I5VQT6_9RHOB|nr:GumC family protein [Tranquillimonas alkanivorans]SFQ09869.1 receptor protein-tyrosine kinase [Tranquillimonas alkanivorans]